MIIVGGSEKKKKKERGNLVLQIARKKGKKAQIKGGRRKKKKKDSSNKKREKEGGGEGTRSGARGESGNSTNEGEPRPRERGEEEEGSAPPSRGKGYRGVFFCGRKKRGGVSDAKTQTFLILHSEKVGLLWEKKFVGSPQQKGKGVTKKGRG